MGEKILLLRLEGPLQSWGERARWDVRDTQPVPTKSGIVGLLGCALGYGVGDVRLFEELDSGLRLAVRVESPGEIREDYQTVSGFLPMANGGFRHSAGTSTRRYDPAQHTGFKEATIVSPRTYLEDASFLAAVSAWPSAPDDILDRCASALEFPVWPLYLGRRCCVATRPIYDRLTDRYTDLEDAIKRHEWSWLGAGKENRRSEPRRLKYEIEDPYGDRTRQDRATGNAVRVYGFRRVRHGFAETKPLEGGWE